MELNNYINSISDKIIKAHNKDIEYLFTKLIENFDIYQRGTNNLVNKKEIISTIFREKSINYCCAATKNGNRCSRKSLENNKYCKIHIFTEYKPNINKTHFSNYSKHEEDLFIVNYNQNNEKEDTDIKISYKNILINDMFYYTDEEWVYDKTTLCKVGYVNENEDNKYILTDDPFILQSL